MSCIGCLLSIQVSCVSFLLDLSIGYGRSSSADGKRRCMEVAIGLAQLLTDPEAQFRLVVAMGTVVKSDHKLVASARSPLISAFLSACQASSVDKLKQCALQLGQLLAD